MAVPSNITDLSVTASSNSPSGSDAVGTSLDDFLRVIQAMLKESGQTLYTATGTDTITFTTTPTFSAYQTGQRFWVKAAGANTGAVTLNINSLGAKNVYKDGSSALVAGDIPAANAVFQVVYDGTQFQCLSCHNINGATTISANSSSAALTITQTGAGNALVVEDETSPDATPFVVSTTGGVGIGKTPSASTPLDLYSSAASAVVFTSDTGMTVQSARYSTDASSANFLIRKGRGTVSSPTAVATNDVLGQIIFQAYGGTNNRNLSAVSSTVSAYTSDTDIATNLTFSTSAVGGVTATEKLRIASDGTTTLGGTSTAPALSVVPVASQTNWVTVTAGASTPATISTNTGVLQITSASNTVRLGSSAANYVQVFGNSAGAAPGVNVQGSDTDININIGAKGAGSVALTTNGGTNQVLVTNTTSANRYITLTGSNGSNPTVSTSAGSLNIGTSVCTPLVTNSAGTLSVAETTATIIQTTAASVYTLPTASSYPGRKLHIVTQFAGTVTSNASNVVPLVGGAAGTAILAATAGKWATLQSNGTNWVIIAAN